MECIMDKNKGTKEALMQLQELFNFLGQEGLKYAWNHSLKWPNGGVTSYPTVTGGSLTGSWDSLVTGSPQAHLMRSVNMGEKPIYVNAKQYKGILKHRQIRKLRQTKEEIYYDSTKDD
ncbi:hypothetical protein SUGI_0562760 [Cryptomeria japonica]|nr:hypothetical protein SUGI_0562760 [Cryptomeria japonica]